MASDHPAPDAPIDAVVAYLRACAVYADAVTNAANRAFDRALRKAIRP